MIEFKNIHKTFGNHAVLKGISGKLESGKCNLIIGGSGTGKSVLLKNIVGLIQPDKGEVYYDGRDFLKAKRTEKKQIRREIGMLFQGSALFDSKTVFENVAFPIEMMTTMPKSEKDDRVYHCLKRVGLESAAKLMPSEISGGMQKRVGIARAIVLNSKYLFCDEPNSGLDPQTAIVIDNLIKEITEEYKTTTVVVTHDMNSVIEIGDKVMFLYKGEKLWEGNNKDILDSNIRELNDFIFANRLMKDLKKLENRC